MWESSLKTVRLVILAALIGGTAAGLQSHAAIAQTGVFAVNTVDSLPDTAPGDGVCLTTSNTCSLYAAIQEANALPGLNEIQFNYCPTTGCMVIFLTQRLPDITSAVRIVGGTVRPVLNGQGLVDDGLRLMAGSDGSTIREMSIVAFTASGIYAKQSDSHVIEGNYIGTDGYNDLGNRWGIFLNGTRAVIIGGNLRNIISGNNNEGIMLWGGTTYTYVHNNYIGTNQAGSAPIPNGAGIRIDNSPHNLIGQDYIGPTQNHGNLIVGGDIHLLIYGSQSAENEIAKNKIGLNHDGTVDFSAHPNSVGLKIQNAPGSVLYSNTIAGHGGYGIQVEGANSGGTYIARNSIGFSGATVMPNGTGIWVNNAPDVHIGEFHPDTSGSSEIDNLGNDLTSTNVSVLITGSGSVGTVLYGNNFGKRPYPPFDAILTPTHIRIIDAPGTLIGSSRMQPSYSNIGKGNTFVGATQQAIEINGTTSAQMAGNHFYGNMTGVVVGNQSAAVATIGGQPGQGNLFWGGYQIPNILIGPHGTLSNSNFNCFVGNSSLQAVANQSTATQGMQSNWWGSVSGPNGNGYTGSGRTVIGAIDASSWLLYIPPHCAMYLGNLLANHSFEIGSGMNTDNWTRSTQMTPQEGRLCGSFFDNLQVRSGYCSMRLIGATGANKSVSQTITTSGSAGDRLQLTGWSWGSNVPANSSGFYRISMIVYSGTTAVAVCTVSFIYESTGYVPSDYAPASCTLTIPSSYTSVVVTAQYSKPSGTVYFDDMSVTSVP